MKNIFRFLAVCWYLLIGLMAQAASPSFQQVTNISQSLMGGISNFPTYNTNYYGEELRYDGMSNLWASLPYDGRTINERALPHFHNNVVQGLATITLVYGDSTADALSHGGLSLGIARVFNQAGAFMTVQGDVTTSVFGWNLSEFDDSSGNNISYGSADTNWFSFYANMPPSSYVTNNWNWTGNELQTAIIIPPGSHKMDFYIQSAYGMPLTLVGSNTFVGNGTWCGFETNIPIPYGTYNPVVESESSSTPTNILLFANICNTNPGTATMYYASATGQHFASWIANEPTNVFIPVMSGLNPSLFIIASKNSPGIEIITNAQAMENNLTNGLPNGDVVWPGTFPDWGYPNTATGLPWEIYGVNYGEWLVAKTYGQMFFDGFDQFDNGSSNLVAQLGHSGDGIHLINVAQNGPSAGAYIWGGNLAYELLRNCTGVNFWATNGVSFINVSGAANVGGTLTFSNTIILGLPSSTYYPIQTINSQFVNFNIQANYSGQYGRWLFGPSAQDTAVGGLQDYQWNPLAPSGGYLLPGTWAMDLTTNGDLYVEDRIYPSNGIVVVGNNEAIPFSAKSGSGKQVIQLSSYNGQYGSWFIGPDYTVGSLGGGLGQDFLFEPLTGAGGYQFPWIWAVDIQTNGILTAQSLVASNNITAYDGVILTSNIWSVAALTNGMPVWSIKFANSNGVPVYIYNSNGVSFVNYFGTSGGILP